MTLKAPSTQGNLSKRMRQNRFTKHPLTSLKLAAAARGETNCVCYFSNLDTSYSLESENNSQTNEAGANTTHTYTNRCCCLLMLVVVVLLLLIERGRFYSRMHITLVNKHNVFGKRRHPSTCLSVLKHGGGRRGRELTSRLRPDTVRWPLFRRTSRRFPDPRREKVRRRP